MPISSDEGCFLVVRNDPDKYMDIKSINGEMDKKIDDHKLIKSINGENGFCCSKCLYKRYGFDSEDKVCDCGSNPNGPCQYCFFSTSKLNDDPKFLDKDSLLCLIPSNMNLHYKYEINRDAKVFHISIPSGQDIKNPNKILGKCGILPTDKVFLMTSNLRSRCVGPDEETFPYVTRIQ